MLFALVMLGFAVGMAWKGEFSITDVGHVSEPHSYYAAAWLVLGAAGLFVAGWYRGRKDKWDIAGGLVGWLAVTVAVNILFKNAVS